jgi:hypothetical protein
MKPTRKYGILAAVVIAAVNLIIGLANWHETGGAAISYIGMATFIFCVYKGMAERRDHEFGGAITYGQAFNAGMNVTFWTSLVAAVLMYAIYKFVDHDFIQMLRSSTVEELSKQDIPDDQRTQALSMIKYIVTPGLLAIGFFIGYVFLGLIVSLIVAAIVKKDPIPENSRPEELN